MLGLYGYVTSMEVVWAGEVTGYLHLPGTQGRWEQHPSVTFAKVTLPQACKHGRGGGEFIQNQPPRAIGFGLR